jgi:hypothetical protein
VISVEEVNTLIATFRGCHIFTASGTLEQLRSYLAFFRFPDPSPKSRRPDEVNPNSYGTPILRSRLLQMLANYGAAFGFSRMDHKSRKDTVTIVA